MYNQSVKEEYINYYMGTSQTRNADFQRKQLENFFKRLGSAEKSFDVDIADADYETMIFILSQVGKGGARSDANAITTCKNYINWAIENNHTSNFENRIEGITVANIDKSAVYRTTMIKDEAELIEYLNICFNDVSNESLDIIFRIYAILVFSGVEATLIKHLPANCVDLSSKTICADGVTISLSDNACEYIRILNNIDSYVVSRGENLSPRMIPKANTGHLLETSSSNRDNMNPYFRSALSKAANRYYKAKHIKKSLSAGSIYRSGIFYRAWLNESIGGTVSIDEYFQFKSTVKNITRSKLLTEYKHWKKAFDL
ncbi:MAG: hypothetical protein RR205_02490 [Oscillospiraceae bacterium]